MTFHASRLTPRDLAIRSKLWSFIKLTRPFFLLAGFALHALGIAAALAQGAAFRPGAALLGQLLITSVQLMTHYVNEYYDVEVDKLMAHSRTLFTGGSGVLPGGSLSPVAASTAAQLFAIVGAVAVLAVGRLSPVAGVIGAAALVGGWAYSAPPWRWVSTGWGELAASLIVAFLTPLTGFVLQTRESALPLVAACVPLVLLHTAMVLAFELPDYEGDRAAGKLTLTVRLGRSRAAALHNTMIVAALLLTLGYSIQWPAARWALLAAPLALWQIVSIRRAQGNPKQMPVLVFGAVCLLALSAGLWLAVQTDAVFTAAWPPSA